MLAVTDLQNNQEPLTDFKQYTRTRKVNGEKTISMSVIPTEYNKHGFPLIGEETTITHDNDDYIVKKYSAKSLGNKYIKRIDGVHKFYVDMINKQQDEIHNGSITFNDYMRMVFEGTGYTFVAVDSFKANRFENLGNDNRLALLSKGLERYQAEMELVGTQVRFKKQIGNDTDFQFRYGHNIKSIEQSVDTTNITTVIRGKWEDGMELEYRSPNADIFGEIEAPLFTNENYTSEETRLEAMKEALEDEPEFSITIDYADMRAAGYPYTVPNEGDRLFIIFEPMNDLMLETRIMEVDETFNAKLEPIKTTVTLANHKKTFAGTMFNNVQKQLGKIVDENGVIKYDILDEAVKIATEALQSAQTELIFDNGIIARDKNDPNKIVLFNSAGIGISDDGGQTFSTAMTGAGIVADVITAGILRGINIIQDDGEGGMVELANGVLQTYLNNGRVMRVDDKGLTMFASDTGSEAGTLRDAQLTSDNSKKGISLNSARDFINIGFGSRGATGAPVLHAKDGEETLLYLNGSRVFESVPDQTRLFYDGYVVFRASDGATRILVEDATAFRAENGAVRLFVDGSSVFRADETGTTLYNNNSGMSGSSMLWSDNSSDLLKLYYRLAPMFSSRFEMMSDLMVDGYVNATDFQDGSLAEIKEDIKLMEESALDMLLNADIHEFYLKSEVEKGVINKKYGFVIGEGYKTPEQILTPDGEKISAYSHRSVNTQAIKEQHELHIELKERVDMLEQENQQLRSDYDNLLKRIEALENAS